MLIGYKCAKDFCMHFFKLKIIKPATFRSFYFLPQPTVWPVYQIPHSHNYSKCLIFAASSSFSQEVLDPWIKFFLILMRTCPPKEIFDWRERGFITSSYFFSSVVIQNHWNWSFMGCVGGGLSINKWRTTYKSFCTSPLLSEQLSMNMWGREVLEPELLLFYWFSQDIDAI